MTQVLSGPLRRFAVAGPRMNRAAFCRIAVLGLGLFSALACQPDSSPTQNPLTGTLAVSVNGMPAGAAAAIVVTGPDGYRRELTASETLNTLPVGNYSVSASEVSAAGDRYAPSVGSQTVTLAPHAVTPATVSYTPITGRIQIVVDGIPNGTEAAVQLSGPAGYTHTVTASEIIAELSPGEYTLSPGTVTAGGTSYLAAGAVQSITVVAGQMAQASVTYVATSGTMAVTVSGLPAGSAASISVTGPSNYSQTLTASGTLSGLVPGTYAITAASVTASGVTYSAAQPSQSVEVPAGGTATVQVTYAMGASGGTSLDFRIDGLYLTQATQRYDGSVPLVAGRDAYLRGFVVANQANTERPSLRVRLYNGATLVQTYQIPASGSGVPTAANQSSLASSWNVLIPGSLIQPGLKVLADVDPNGTIAETDRDNNQFPVSGTPQTVDVRTLPTFQVRLVPVLQQTNGLSGNVTSANLESFLGDLKQMLPVSTYNADLHTVYTTTAPALQSGNGNSAWNTILSELLALRTADASTQYYYGVVKASYTSGVAGMGFVGGTARTAVGWDYLPSGSNVMAHEIGHTMGRQHAPCGAVGGPDPAYPYAGGTIGVWGLQVNGLVLKAPTTADLMGYCQPTWISDYNWSAMVEYRQSGPSAVVGAGAGEGLLVWGRIGAGGIVLEPGFVVPLESGAAPAPGSDQLELLAADGSVLRTVSFGAPLVGDLPGSPERQFAFVVPAGPNPDAIAGLRVRSGGLVATRLTQPGGEPELAVRRVDADRVSVRWNVARYPMAMVRDAATGRVLSFARGGDATLWARTDDVDVTLSTGTRTIFRRERVLK